MEKTPGAFGRHTSKKWEVQKKLRKKETRRRNYFQQNYFKSTISKRCQVDFIKSCFLCFLLLFVGENAWYMWRSGDNWGTVSLLLPRGSWDHTEALGLGQPFWLSLLISTWCPTSKEINNKISYIKSHRRKKVFSLLPRHGVRICLVFVSSSAYELHWQTKCSIMLEIRGEVIDSVFPHYSMNFHGTVEYLTKEFERKGTKFSRNLS